MRRFTLLSIVATMILGIYVLPSVTARFAGSHTWELNTTEATNARVAQLNCGKCHVYIKNEFTAGSFNVSTAHKAASNTSAYINNTFEAFIQMPTPSGSDDDVCLMCHAVETGLSYEGHTRVTIRACTDGDCHGNHTEQVNQSAKVALFGQKLNIVDKLNSSADAHRNFYRPLSQQNSTYTMEDAGSSTLVETADTNDNSTYSAGFFACMGCHTHVGVQMTIGRPSIYNFSLNTTDGSSWVATSPTANDTLINYTVSAGTSGSKWL